MEGRWIGELGAAPIGFFAGRISMYKHVEFILFSPTSVPSFANAAICSA